jgi:hypothetical protein
MDSKTLLERAKFRGIILAEESMEQTAKGLAHLAIDILEDVVKDTENAIDDVAFAAIQGIAREMADKIEVNL